MAEELALGRVDESAPYCLSGQAPGVDGDIEHVLVDGKQVHFEQEHADGEQVYVDPGHVAGSRFTSSRNLCMAIRYHV